MIIIFFSQPGLLGLKGKLGAGMAKSSLQSIGLQLGKQVLNVPSKPTKSVKSMKVPVSYTHLTLPTICSV